MKRLTAVDGDSLVCVSARLMPVLTGNGYVFVLG